MKTMLIGVGAAGNKAVLNAIKKGIMKVEDTIIINSTSKDFPKGYSGRKIILSRDDTGCGKEVSIAHEYAVQAIKDGKLEMQNINQYSTVIFCTSVEGGTGSGSTPVLAQFVAEVYGRNVHIIAFTGFEEDPRGLQNTIQFFKNMKDNLTIQTIRNSAFLKDANGDKLEAERLANDEMNERIRIITGQDFIYSDQNIDDTDIAKVMNTKGYMTVEHIYIDKPLETKEEFIEKINEMVDNSKSLQPEEPLMNKLGVIVNFDKKHQKVIDDKHDNLIDRFGNPFEVFTHIQWDKNREYIAIVISGMNMPIEEIESIYDRYKEMSDKVNKKHDSFFDKMNQMDLDDSNSKFDMFKPVDKKNTSVSDFLSKIQGGE